MNPPTNTARNTKRDTAREAATDAARDTAQDTARDTARDGTREAARDTARDAATDAVPPAYGLLRDGSAMLGRQLRRVRNNPGLLILTQTMPITMLLFFGYVFGSALAMPGAEYRAFLVPGLLVATAANGLMTGMFQAAQDAHRGVTDRLRTLPVSRAAVPLGQSVADVLVTAAGTVPVLLVGLAVDWRVEGGAAGAVGAVGLLLLFRFATTWIGIFLGLLTRNEEAAGQLGGATFILPLLSNAYIPTEGLPGWLRTVAEWNPISAVTTALRDLFGNAPVPDGAAWPVAHPVAGSLGWCALLLAVFVPLAVRRYAHGGR